VCRDRIVIVSDWDLLVGIRVTVPARLGSSECDARPGADEWANLSRAEEKTETHATLRIRGDQSGPARSGK
jgi:hypothetical protein